MENITSQIAKFAFYPFITRGGNEVDEKKESKKTVEKEEKSENLEQNDDKLLNNPLSPLQEKLLDFFLQAYWREVDIAHASIIGKFERKNSMKEFQHGFEILLSNLTHAIPQNLQENLLLHSKNGQFESSMVLLSKAVLGFTIFHKLKAISSRSDSPYSAFLNRALINLKEPNSLSEIVNFYEQNQKIESVLSVYYFISDLAKKKMISDEMEKKLLRIDPIAGAFAEEVFRQYLVDELLLNSEKNSDNIRSLFGQEILDLILTSDESNFFQAINERWIPILYVQKIKEELVQLNENLRAGEKLSECNQETVFSQLRAIEKSLQEKGFLYRTTIKDNFDYCFCAALGNAFELLRECNDTIHYSGDEQKDEFRHEACGCHFAYAEDLVKEHRILPIQQVDIIRKMRKLEEQLQKLEQQRELTDETEKLYGRTKESLELAKKILFEKPPIDSSEKRKEIPIHKTLGITCSYGTGHNMTAAAVASYFGAEGSHVQVADPSTDVFLPLQPLHKFGKLIGKEWTGTEWFNWVLRNQKYTLHNRIKATAQTINKYTGLRLYDGVFPPNEKISSHEELLIKRFLIEKPKLLFTVYHMALNLVFQAAKRMGIPIMHIATDFDVKMREPFLEAPMVKSLQGPPKYPYYRLLIPSDDEKVMATTKPIPKEKIRVSGMALRPELFVDTPTEILDQMRKQRGLSADTKVVMVMGGGGGQDLPFPEALANDLTLEGKWHVIVVAGSNKAFGDRLISSMEKTDRKNEEDLPILQGKNPNVTIEIATDLSTATEKAPYHVGPAKLSTLYDLADVLVTKPGGLSTGEGTYKGLPLVFDHRKKELFPWEEDNVQTVVTAHRGNAIYDVKETKQKVLEAIQMGKDVKHDKFKRYETKKVLWATALELIEEVKKDPTMQDKVQAYSF